MPVLVSVQVLKGVKVWWDWTITPVDDLWTLHHVFEGLASGGEGCEEGELWVLDPTYCVACLLCARWACRRREIFSEFCCPWLPVMH